MKFFRPVLLALLLAFVAVPVFAAGNPPQKVQDKSFMKQRAADYQDGYFDAWEEPGAPPQEGASQDYINGWNDSIADEAAEERGDPVPARPVTKPHK